MHVPFSRTIKKHLKHQSASDFMCDNPRYSRFSIGRFSYGKPNVLFQDCNSTLVIGSFCSIGGGVTILLGGGHGHHTERVTTFPFDVLGGEEGTDWVAPSFDGKLQEFFKRNSESKKDVIIGNDVWIGLNALILSGVHIGDGAVIGANSVVSKDVEPYSIVAGNPIRVIRKRFSQETIESLLKIAWWNWSIEKINRNLPFLLSSDIKKFIEAHKGAAALLEEMKQSDRFEKIITVKELEVIVDNNFEVNEQEAAIV